MKVKNPKLSDVRKALSGKQLLPQQAAQIVGGSYPWVDEPRP